MDDVTYDVTVTLIKPIFVKLVLNCRIGANEYIDITYAYLYNTRTKFRGGVVTPSALVLRFLASTPKG